MFGHSLLHFQQGSQVIPKLLVKVALSKTFGFLASATELEGNPITLRPGD